MPDLDARLAADLVDLRTGRGPRREDLRRRLHQVDAGLRNERNRTRLRLAQLQVMARTADTRQRPPAELQHALEQCAAKLAALDSEIVRAVAAIQSETALPTVAPALRPQDQADPASVAAAKVAVRNRLWLAASLIDGLPLPAELVRRMKAAIAAKIRRLEA
jgi:hypothetical protein